MSKNMECEFAIPCGGGGGGEEEEGGGGHNQHGLLTDCTNYTVQATTTRTMSSSSTNVRFPPGVPCKGTWYGIVRHCSSVAKNTINTNIGRVAIITGLPAALSPQAVCKKRTRGVARPTTNNAAPRSV